ncbi:MAG: WG repeat-containing protein [Pyrinomonadaceae bacterium]|nr:WG repeat-containing protein [Pyrinomonadaceae bacterium]
MHNSDQKFQFIDRNFKVVLNAGTFTQARKFSEGLAPVMTGNGRWGYMGITGEVQINPIFEEAGDFSEGLARVKVSDKDNWDSYKWNFIDKQGKAVIETDFDVVYDFSEGIALAIKKDSVFSVSRDGHSKPLFSTRDFSLGPESNPLFKKGLLVVRDESSKKYGYMDLDGQIRIDAIYENAATFSEGIARVSVKINNRELLGFIEENGRFVIEPAFDIDFDFQRNSGDFRSGLARINYYNDQGELQTLFIDRAGETIFSTSFQVISDFHEGFAVIYKAESDMFGYIDTTGKQKLTPQFRQAMDFSEGLACVETESASFGD